MLLKIIVAIYLWTIMIEMSAGIVNPLLKPSDGEQVLQPVTWNCVQRVEALTTWKFIQSRGYPNFLNVKQSRCSWKIVSRPGSRIRLAFKGVDLYADDPNHCSSNYVEIIDETLNKAQARYCGKKIPNDIVSEGNQLRIDFQAQPGIATNSRGFSIGYARTIDPSGFYSWQSLGPQKRPQLIQPPPRNKRPSGFIPFPDDIDSTDDEDEDEGGSPNLGIVFGVVIACVALILIGYIIWKKKQELLAFKKNLKKEKESNSTATFSFPPQSETDPFERIMSMVEPFPAPSENNGLTYKSGRTSSASYRSKYLPEYPPDYPFHNIDKMSCHSRGGASTRSSATKLTSRPYLPRSTSRNSSHQFNEKFRDEVDSVLTRKASSIHEPLLETERLPRLSSRSTFSRRSRNRESQLNPYVNQSANRPKLYHPETNLSENDEEQTPPPLPPKEKNKDAFHDGRMVQNDRRSRQFSRSVTSLNEVGKSARKSTRGTREPQFLNKFQTQRSRSTSNLFEDNARSSSRLGPPRRSYIDDEFKHASRFNTSFRSRPLPSVHSFRDKEEVRREELGSRTMSRSSRFSGCRSMTDFDKDSEFIEAEQWGKTFDELSSFSGSKRGCDNASYRDHNRNNIQRSALVRSASRHSLGSRYDSEQPALLCLPPPLPVKKKKMMIR